MSIRQLLSQASAPAAVAQPSVIHVHGWVRSARIQKSWSFMEVNDGSCARNLQVVWPNGRDVLGEADVKRLATGASVSIEGSLVPSPKPGQPVELHAASITVVGGADPAAYPIQKKAHTPEFLREVVHLRPRSAAAGAVLRVRDTLAAALHAVLRGAGCTGVHTPILTGNDCEGAGELFAVLPAAHLREYGAPTSARDPPPPPPTSSPSSSSPSAAALASPSHQPPGGPDPYRFFGKPVYLTVSGQLHLEAFACSLGRVYTFGPTFRAENSNTARHAAEFWMVEPELAPGGLSDAMALAEACVKGALRRVLEERSEDVSYLSEALAAEQEAHAGLSGGKDGEGKQPPGKAKRGGEGKPQDGDAALLARLAAMADPETPFAVMTYNEAVAALQGSGHTFSAPVVWAEGLASEHERWLADTHARRPLFVTHYPAAIKPFYMKASQPGMDGAPATGDSGGSGGPTVQAFDLLVPGLGELVGGGAREDDYDVLARRMAAAGLLSPERVAAMRGRPDGGRGMPPADTGNSSLDWYLDTRRFGGLPHAGFGLGFDRLVMVATGAGNIRDVLPVPRVPDSCRM